MQLVDISTEKPAKICNRCSEAKSEDSFYVDKRRHAPYSTCKTCWNTASKEWNKNNPDSRRRASRDSAYRQRWKRIFRDYGITKEEYYALLEWQNGVCGICKKPETKVSRSRGLNMLAVDHCHRTGRVRGLLCARCNGVLGWVSDDTSLLRRMSEYINENDERYLQ